MSCGTVVVDAMRRRTATGVSAAHRLDWVLSGLASAIGWLAPLIDSAGIAMTVLAVTAMAVTIVQLLRLRRPRKDEPAHGLN